MKWIADIVSEDKWQFEIEHDENVGYYLYIWKNDKGIADYLQDTLEIAMEQARDDFGVPLEAWKRVE